MSELAVAVPEEQKTGEAKPGAGASEAKPSEAKAAEAAEGKSSLVEYEWFRDLVEYATAVARRPRLSPEEISKNIEKALVEALALECAMRAANRVKRTIFHYYEDTRRYVDEIIKETIHEVVKAWREQVDRMIEEITAVLKEVPENTPKWRELQQRLNLLRRIKEIYDKEGVEKFIRKPEQATQTQPTGQASTPQPGPSTTQQTEAGTGQATTPQPGSTGPSTTTPTTETTKQTTSGTTQTEGSEMRSGTLKESNKSQTPGGQQQ